MHAMHGPPVRAPTTSYHLMPSMTTTISTCRGSGALCKVKHVHDYKKMTIVLQCCQSTSRHYCLQQTDEAFDIRLSYCASTAGSAGLPAALDSHRPASFV